jgi:hypothetical protein
MTVNEQADYGTRKLAHYNKWLLDRDRIPGVPYAGFPEDNIKPKGKKMQSPVVASMASTLSGKKGPSVAPAVKKTAKISTGPKSGTKTEAAIAIYNRHSGIKALTITAIQTELGMSLAGATTYFYNAKKASR